jgi:hypothetical protein
MGMVKASNLAKSYIQYAIFLRFVFHSSPSSRLLGHLAQWIALLNRTGIILVECGHSLSSLLINHPYTDWRSAFLSQNLGLRGHNGRVEKP